MFQAICSLLVPAHSRRLSPAGASLFPSYSTYCRRDYWRWVEKRNDERSQNTLLPGKNYAAKNLMHTFRLLNMAEESCWLGHLAGSSDGPGREPPRIEIDL